MEKETLQKNKPPIFVAKMSWLLLNEVVKTLLPIGCYPYKLVPTMNAIVANAIIVFKCTMINI